MSESLHCNCFARLQIVRMPYEFAITPANIKHEEFHEKIGKKFVETTCTDCGTKFYVGYLKDLENL